MPIILENRKYVPLTRILVTLTIDKFKAEVQYISHFETATVATVINKETDSE